jgi:NADPH:quinone reductase-like Zn-dependent oxidoreductase
MTDLMRAVVLVEPGPVDRLEIREIPIPDPRTGWVLIAVQAFGLNRSELFTRQGFSGDSVTYPRVLGIEAAGVVAACPGGEFTAGQQVFALMGGMGRTYDGGYAEYVSVPASQVIAFTSSLPWSVLGAVPVRAHVLSVRRTAVRPQAAGPVQVAVTVGAGYPLTASGAV